VLFGSLRFVRNSASRIAVGSEREEFRDQACRSVRVWTLRGSSTLRAYLQELMQAPRIQVDHKHCAALRKDWVRALNDFDEAVGKCRGALSEKRVHALRLSGRRCVPILEIMRALHPRDATWRTARHLVKGIIRVLGPLRDAQVRQLRLKEMNGVGTRALISRAKAEEQRARPSAKAALGLVGRLPVRALEDALSLGQPQELDELSQAISRLMHERQRTMQERKVAVHVPEIMSIHRARISLKRYRYLLLAIKPCLNAQQRKRLPALKTVQTAIGEYHDAALFRAWLKTSGKPGAQIPACSHGSDSRKDTVALRKVLERTWTL